MYKPDKYKLHKIERLARGEMPRVVDLFSGCGGLSLGFQAAGFEIIGNLEIDEIAARTHACNFHPFESTERQQLFARPRDITQTNPKDFLKELYPNYDPTSLVDVIIGGPPCQAFARIGRAKLREVADHPEAFKLDSRASLYIHYINYVKELKPLAIVMENVPDILNFGGHNIPQEICETFDVLGYECSYTLLNAVYFGVPQMRERLFLIGIAKEVGIYPSFPTPTHWIELPQGYDNARKVALKTIGQQNAFEVSNFVNPPMANKQSRKAVSAQEAIGDLPPITLHLEGLLTRGARRLNDLISYPNSDNISEYALAMRNWPKFENHEGIYDHVIRYLPRDYAIFRCMKPGDQYPEAYKVAIDLFKEKLQELRQKGESIEEGSDRYNELWTSIVPPYDPSKFPNKWRKMEADLPARTLMAHLGKDGYSHIHYDSNQARTISVREAARLQSFPDGFRFEGTMNPAFRQIGNAVAPLLAKALGQKTMELLRYSINGTNFVEATCS